MESLKIERFLRSLNNAGVDPRCRQYLNIEDESSYFSYYRGDTTEKIVSEKFVKLGYLAGYNSVQNIDGIWTHHSG